MKSETYYDMYFDLVVYRYRAHYQEGQEFLDSIPDVWMLMITFKLGLGGCLVHFGFSEFP